MNAPHSMSSAPAAILHFDPHCPVCKSFAKLIRRKISEEELPYQAMSEEEALQADSFVLELTSEDDTKLKLEGPEAIDKLAELYPAIREYFWMLPSNWHAPAMETTWRVGKWMRSIMNRLSGRKCDC
jgi:predicted DCC family thiol-disulfide oxidoreductase YuxK